MDWRIMSILGKPTAALALALATTAVIPAVGGAAEATFTNPLWRGADPWIVRDGDTYYHCNAARGNSIEVWKSDRLYLHGQRKAVWTAPETGWNRAMVWAPELHRIGPKWYIYYAASAGENASHRMGVLESATGDPQGKYIDRGPLYTGDDPSGKTENRWAIDGTVFEIRGQRYLVWSGWQDHRDIQHLFIAKMKDPVTVATARVRLCANDSYPWERVGEDPRQRGLHEGPAILQRGGRIFIVYSCSGSWQASYKLGLLWADDRADLLDPRNWKKRDHPAFASAGEVFGVGHCSFTTSIGGKEDWILYHSKVQRREGWDREVRAQRFAWTEDGFPDFGRPIPSGTPIPAPAEGKVTAPR